MNKSLPKWYRLDHAAKIYPSFVSEEDTATFRVAAILYEKIEPVRLQTALETVIKRFPSMAVRMRKGFFWYYFDSNDSLPTVHEEESSPCRAINTDTNNGYLFKVFYYNRRIALECFHALTDGYGALEFLKTLLYVYLNIEDKEIENKEIEHENVIKLPHQKTHQNETEDSFITFSKPRKSDLNSDYEQLAQHILGTPFEKNGLNVTHGVLSASELNGISKKKGVTITVYLTALYILCIHKANKTYGTDTKPITVAVPVNLRKIFPSKTMRNFSFYVNIEVKPMTHLTFDHILMDVKTQLKEGIKKQKLYDRIHHNVKIEKNILMRLTPILIKDMILKRARNVHSKNVTTTTLTNSGIIQLPETMNKYVEHFEFVIYAATPHYLNCGVCSYNDKLVISMTRVIKETHIIKAFFQYLRNETKLDIQIYGNEWGE